MFRETRAATHQFSRAQREHVKLSWVFAPSPLEDEVVLSACSEVRRAENHVVRICLWEEIGALKSPCQLPHPFPREWWASMKARGICLLMKGEWHQGCLEGRFTFESVFPVERGGFPCAFSHSLPFLFFFFLACFSLHFFPSFSLPPLQTLTHTYTLALTHQHVHNTVSLLPSLSGFPLAALLDTAFQTKPQADQETEGTVG